MIGLRKRKLVEGSGRDTKDEKGKEQGFVVMGLVLMAAEFSLIWLICPDT